MLGKMPLGLSWGMWPAICMCIIGILDPSCHAVDTFSDYMSEDGNPIVHINAKLCGNGKLDPGETCDCGLGVQKCPEDSCCQTNCQLKLHSLCSNSDPCCEKCRFKSRESICHKPRSDCDIPQRCTGYTSSCPANAFKRNGANCTGELGEGICYNGSCKSFTQPCQETWKRSETEPVREFSKCSSGSICINQSCVPIKDFNHLCPRGLKGLECSGQGDCSFSHRCHCLPGWKGSDCSIEDTDDPSEKLKIYQPGKVTKTGPEQQDSKSNTTALVGGLVFFVIFVSIIFVVMAFRYIPSRPPKDETTVYPPQGTAGTTEAEPEQPIPAVIP